ncbi:hypothetical protein TNCV_3877111 [Trichonephila clavipes]|uniref:Uncharacterized protein n=1 Tax=Trichonephila clavipes TaxID=2585209 RepID=A0A8X6T5E8_TRICX|nr:hypothetical protein TNCV_3877111 [Trichonephila clavipes]
MHQYPTLLLNVRPSDAILSGDGKPVEPVRDVIHQYIIQLLVIFRADAYASYPSLQYVSFDHYVVSNSPRWIEDETFNGSDIMNILIDYEDGQEELDYLRVDKNMRCGDPAFQQIGKSFS